MVAPAALPRLRLHDAVGIGGTSCFFASIIVVSGCTCDVLECFALSVKGRGGGPIRASLRTSFQRPPAPHRHLVRSPSGCRFVRFGNSM